MVYLKEGDQIVEVLRLMDAPQALMEFENIRILKEMRGNVNRQVNCETANINKTVSAAVKQTEDIEYIRDTIGLRPLPDNLQEIARVRLMQAGCHLKGAGGSVKSGGGKVRREPQAEKAQRVAEDAAAGGSLSDAFRFQTCDRMRRIIMLKKCVRVELPSGLEARPAAMLVQTASQYESKIYLETDGKRVNAKSIMGMMTLGLVAGGMIKVEADGTDEEQAVAQIEKYLTNQ